MKRRYSLAWVLLALPAIFLFLSADRIQSQTGAPDPKYLQRGGGKYADQWKAPSTYMWIDPDLFTPNNPIVGTFDGETCVSCHTGVTPGIVNDWKASKHAAAKVYCLACHGNDHQKLAMPKPETCGNCHKQQVVQFREQLKAGHPSHARAMNPDIYDISFQRNKPEADVAGCAHCHRIGGGANGGGGGCDSCHTRHKFSAAQARQPAACQGCHSGASHRDYEIYEMSGHGLTTKFESPTTDWTKPLKRGNYRAPTCAYCHMYGGDHNIVRLTVYPPGGRTKEVDRGAPEHKEKRGQWIAICSDCHSSRFGRAHLDAMDETVKVGFKKLREARKIIEDLYKEGLMEPMPQFLAPDWKGGHTPAFGARPHNLPLIERAFWEMVVYSNGNVFKGAAHFSGEGSTYTYGSFESDKHLATIKSEAEKMRRLARIEKKIGVPYVPSEFWKRGEFTDILPTVVEPKAPEKAKK